MMKGARERFLREMLADVEGLSEAAAVEIEQATAFGQAPPLVRTAMRRSNNACYSTLIDLMRDARPARAEELERLMRGSLPPQNVGITFDDLLHAYRIAAEMFWRHFRDVASSYPSLEQDFLLESGVVGHRLLVDLTMAVAQRYFEVERVRARKEDAGYSIVAALIKDPPRFEEASRIARSIGLALTGSWLVAAATTPESDADPKPVLVSSLQRQFERLGRHTIVTVYDGVLVAIISADGRDPALPFAGVCTAVGIGGMHEGPQGIRTSYEEAHEALAIALRKQEPVVSFEHSWLDRFLLGAISAAELGEAVLTPLRDLPHEKRTRLIDTLEAYLDAGGSVVRAARTLHLHPQSLRYRLSLLQKMLGRSLLSPEGRLALSVAVKAARLFDEDSTRRNPSADSAHSPK